MPQLDLEVFFEQIAGFYLVFVVLLGQQINRGIHNHTLAIKLRKFVIETNNKQSLLLKNEKAVIVKSFEKILLK